MIRIVLAIFIIPNTELFLAHIPKTKVAASIIPFTLLRTNAILIPTWLS